MGFEEFIVSLMLVIACYFMYQDLFYKEEKKQCMLHGGVCEECNCWSCKRKEILLKKDEIGKK